MLIFVFCVLNYKIKDKYDLIKIIRNFKKAYNLSIFKINYKFKLLQCYIEKDKNIYILSIFIFTYYFLFITKAEMFYISWAE